METVLHSLLPIFLIIALGFALTRQGMVDEVLRNGFNKLAYWVALPLLLFYKIADAPLGGNVAGQLFLMGAGATAASFFAAWILGRAIKLPGPSQGVFVQAAFRGNLAFVGLPVIMYAVESLAPESASHIETCVILAMIPLIILYNVAAVAVLVAHGGGQDGAHGGRMVRQLWTNPLIIACTVGLVWNVADLSLPLFATRTCATLGNAAFPMVLIAIGSQLAETRLGKQLGITVLAGLLKTVLTPLAGYLIGRQLGLSPLELRAGLILMATPTAVASYVLADQLGGDAPLAAGTIVVSLGMSLLSLGLILMLPMG